MKASDMLVAQKVAAAIILKQGHVLVTRRALGQKLAGFWEFPGGKLEPGETLGACIERELAEELGIDGEAGEVIATNVHIYPAGAIELIAIHVRIATESFKLAVHDEARWVTGGELLSLELAPADVPIADTVCALLEGMTVAER